MRYKYIDADSVPDPEERLKAVEERVNEKNIRSLKVCSICDNFKQCATRISGGEDEDGSIIHICVCKECVLSMYLELVDVKVMAKLSGG
jgi:hypothetical protein